MTTTSTRIVFGLFDVAIKLDSTPSSASGMWTYTDLDTLRSGNIPRLPTATYEDDLWLLDGNYKFYTSSQSCALISTEISDASGDFGTAPVLTIDFSTTHSVDAITLRFSPFTGDYADEINVKFYNGVSLLYSDDYTPTAPEFTTDRAVVGFDQIVITFNATNRPYRRLRLEAIDYGDVIEFDNTSIQTAQLVEEIDPLSGEMRSNSLEFTLYSDDPGFNALEPDFLPTERQPIFLYQTVDSVEIFMGMFFLDNWTTTSETQIEFECIDLLGLIEKIPCRGGQISGFISSELEDLLDDLGIPFFNDHTASLAVQGWIPYRTLRDAIHAIAIATGSVTCARSTTIRFHPSPLLPSLIWYDGSESLFDTLTNADMGIDQTLILLPDVLEVYVGGHTFIDGPDQRVLVDETLVAGTYEIVFDKPMHTMGVTNATIDESGANYAILTVASTLAVELTGYEVVDSVQIYPSLDDGDNLEKTIRVIDATLIGGVAPNATTTKVRNNLTAYYQNYRYLQKTTVFASTIYPGQTVLADSWYDSQLLSVITKMSTDLTGGMVTSIEMTGSKIA